MKPKAMGGAVFQPVSSRVSFPEIDKRVLQLWKERDVFRRTETEREDGPLFMLYEGPPTANGSPGVHHVPGPGLQGYNLPVQGR